MGVLSYPHPAICWVGGHYLASKKCEKIYNFFTVKNTYCDNFKLNIAKNIGFEVLYD